LTRPRPQGCVPYRRAPVEIQVAADFQQISLSVHQDCLEAPLEQVIYPVAAAVVGLGVDPVDVAHQQGHIPLPGVQHEVVVVGHQAVGQGPRIEP